MIKTFLGTTTIAGLLVVVLAFALKNAEENRAYERVMQHQPPEYTFLPITLFWIGISCFILAGVPWAHTSGMKKLKVALMGLIGGVVGAAAGGWCGHLLFKVARPHARDAMAWEELGWIFGGMWVVGLMLAFLGIRQAVRFHRRFATEPSAAPDRGGRGM